MRNSARDNLNQTCLQYGSECSVNNQNSKKTPHRNLYHVRTAIISPTNRTKFTISIRKPRVPLPSCHFQAFDELLDFPDLNISIRRTFFRIIVGGRHLKLTVLLPSGNNPQQYFQVDSEESLPNPCQNGADEHLSCPAGATQSPMSNRFSDLLTKSGSFRIVRCVLELNTKLVTSVMQL